MTSRVVNSAAGSSSSTSSSPRNMRTIILCFDGTSNEYSSENTNVVKLCSLFKRDNDKQVVYYQAGIGTYVTPSIVSTPYTWLAKVLDQAFAIYLSTHVMEGYKFLMQNYNVGDRVCLFGFSRGAYTARALAGMLNKVGLLGKDNDEQVSFAYKMYASTDTRDDGTAAGFKQTFCREVPIDFLGVWETVASVGVVMGRTLPFVTNNHAIKTFRQALALDEHRAKFRPNFYMRFTPKVRTPRSAWHKLADLVCCRTAQPDESRSDSTEPHVSMNGVQKGEASPSDSGPSFETDVREVWFAGCHSDVGGGNWPNDTAQALQNIPLRWMVREVMKAECGVVWEEAAFTRLGIPFGVPGSDGVQTSDAADASQPITDALTTTPLWWLLEVIPTEYSYVDEKKKQWVHEWSIHLGRGRYVPKDGALFHSSVKQRMDNGSLKYKPRARYEDIQIAYVD